MRSRRRGRAARPRSARPRRSPPTSHTQYLAEGSVRLNLAHSSRSPGRLSPVTSAWLPQATGPAVDPVAKEGVTSPRCSRVGSVPLFNQDCWPQGQLYRAYSARSRSASGTPPPDMFCVLGSSGDVSGDGFRVVPTPLRPPSRRASLLLSRGSRRLFCGQGQYPSAWEAAVSAAELFATEVRPLRSLICSPPDV